MQAQYKTKCSDSSLKDIDRHGDTVRGVSHGPDTKEGSGTQGESLEGVQSEYRCPGETGDQMEVP